MALLEPRLMMMKRALSIFLLLSCGVFPAVRAPQLPGIPLRVLNAPAAGPESAFAAEAGERRSEQSYSRTALGLPLTFEENKGQVDGQVRFLARGRGYTIFLTPGEAVMSLFHSSTALREASKVPAPDALAEMNAEPRLNEEIDVLRFKLMGLNGKAVPPTSISGVGELAAQSSYFIGNDPAKWHTGVHHFTGARYSAVYPGIDLIFYANNDSQLEFDFALAPGADYQQIRLRFDGAQTTRIDEQGRLVVKTAHAELVQHKPRVYQISGGERRDIEASYVRLPRRCSSTPP